MKATKTFTLLVLLAGLALAQTTGTKATPSKKTSTTTKPAATTTKPAATTTKPVSPMAPKTSAPKITATHNPKMPVKATSTAPKTPAHRDPFVSPVAARVGGPGGPVACSSGQRCLVIDQITLQGVIQTVNGPLALVANAANRTYTLHENDPLWDGYVVKIMLDSKSQTGAVIFRQNVTDKVGNKSTRDVTKRVEAPAI
jgi:hypothetical protein